MVTTSSISIFALILPLLLLLLAIVGFVVFLRGWRGRRLGDHPMCGQCGFDLFGAPTDCTRCPECGADLSKPRAIVVGVRHRRRGLVAMGLILMLIGLGPVAGLATAVGSNVDWGQFRPTWYAMREAAGSLPGDRVAAIDLLIARCEAGKLSAESRGRLADLLITLHNDAGQSWSDSWSGWLGNEVATGRLSAAQRDAFVRSMMPTSFLRVRPAVHEGDPWLPIEYGVNEALRPTVRGGRGVYANWITLAARLRSDDLEVLIDGQPLARSGGGSSTRSFAGRGDMSQYEHVRLPTTLPAGPHEITVRNVIEVLDRFEAPTALCTMPLSATATLQVVPKDKQLVKRTSDPTFGPVLKSVIRPVLVIGAAGDTHLNVRYDRGLIPCGVGFDVVVKQGTHEWKIGAFAVRGGDGTSGGVNSSSWSYGFDGKGLAEGKADVHFIPSISAANGTLDVFEIWDGELLFADVPVTRRQ